MAGIYIHIPFCKQACYYCNFHFSTSMQLKDQMLAAIQQELRLQQAYLEGIEITSIYFGGGTPSLLEAEVIRTLLLHIQQLFPCQKVLEITLEANPDDINLEKLLAWRAIGVNRLSIGIQSFQDDLLKYLNRIHHASKSISSLEMVLQAGFENFNIDLIYAIPGQSEQMLKNDLALATQFQPKHIAAYCLTIEPNTVLGRWLDKGKVKAVEDDLAAQHFSLLVATLEDKHYEHYEISNFSLPHYHSQHNTNYWKRGSYLGVGPGAHSYNGITRQYNIAHNQHYVQHLQKGIIPSTVEILQLRDHINEYIMTSLRTKWGCEMELLKKNYQYDLQMQHFAYLEQLVARQLACIHGNTLVLTTAGKLLADKIAADLFVA